MNLWEEFLNEYEPSIEEPVSDGEFIPRDDTMAFRLANQFVDIASEKGNPMLAKKMATQFYKKLMDNIDNCFI